jgi:hypothetical protein
MSDTADAGTRIADHNLVATYDTPDAARAALTMLERHGVESGDIELFGPGMRNVPGPVTNDEQRKADMAVTGTVAKRGMVGVVVAAVVGAVIGAVVALVAGAGGGVVIGAALGGFVLGGPVGWFYGGASALPVSGEEWEDTFTSDGGPTSVAVHSADEAEIEAAKKALRGTNARRMATCGRDGQLRDVA